MKAASIYLTLALKFRPSRDETNPWANRKPGNNPKRIAEYEEGTIQWAGENHKRQSFRKTKDYIADWTNVLFRSWTTHSVSIDTKAWRWSVCFESQSTLFQQCDPRAIKRVVLNCSSTAGMIEKFLVVSSDAYLVREYYQAECHAWKGTWGH